MIAPFSCRKAVRLANAAMDRPLRWSSRLELRLHLAMCSACRAYRRQAILLDRMIRQHQGNDLPDPLPPEARERIRQALRARRPH